MATYTTPVQELAPAAGTPITWAKEIHDGLLAVGLTQTSDTGQMSMTSLPVAVATTSTSYGYTIYQWTDAYQSTYPLYMKIEWRNNGNAGTPTMWNMWISLGSGTNGSGVLTSQFIIDSTAYTSSAAMTGTRAPSYICYKDGGLTIALSPAATYSVIGKNFISISRFINVSTGNPEPGIYMFKTGNNSLLGTEKMFAPSRATQYMSSTTPSTGTMSMNTSAFWTSESDVIVSGGDTYTPVYQPLVMIPKLCTLNSWIAPYNTITGDFTWQRWGQTHTYKAFAAGTYQLNPNGKTNFAMRWE